MKESTIKKLVKSAIGKMHPETDLAILITAHDNKLDVVCELGNAHDAISALLSAMQATIGGIENPKTRLAVMQEVATSIMTTDLHDTVKDIAIDPSDIDKIAELLGDE